MTTTPNSPAGYCPPDVRLEVERAAAELERLIAQVEEEGIARRSFEACRAFEELAEAGADEDWSMLSELSGATRLRRASTRLAQLFLLGAGDTWEQDGGEPPRWYRR
jgi:hypothetical protein